MKKLLVITLLVSVINLLGVPIPSPSIYAAEGDTNFTNVVASGYVNFQTNLVAMGRIGGASTASSSSTSISAAALTFSVWLKHVGGGAGLDTTGVGTVLPNGTDGQTLTVLVQGLQGTGSWDITPDTKTGFTSLTCDAVGEFATLVYVNDTVGWITLASTCTVVKDNALWGYGGV